MLVATVTPDAWVTKSHRGHELERGGHVRVRLFSWSSSVGLEASGGDPIPGQEVRRWQFPVGRLLVVETQSPPGRARW